MTDDELTRLFFRCGACGADNETTRNVCENCGAEREDAPGRFQIHLGFAAGTCLDCDEEGFPGDCPKCGGQIADAPEANAATTARVKALGPLWERAREIVASFDEFPMPHITVTASQLVFTVRDAGLENRAIALIEFASNADDLDLADPAAIGAKTRRTIVEALDEAEKLRDWARLLAEFKSDERVTQLPVLVARLGRVGAVVIENLIAVLASETPAAAGARILDLQEALEPPPEADEIMRLHREIPTLGTPEDVNARVAFITGREGDYTDELGLPSPVAIFTPPPGMKSSFELLGQGASSYLSHLLDGGEASEEALAMLTFPAVDLALLDRPFEHHRRAELIREMLREANATDPAALDAALVTYANAAEQAFETSMRVRRQIRLLATGNPEPIDVVESSVRAYRQLAEGTFRAAIRCVLTLRAAVAGGNPPPESMLLGAITERLSGWHDELGTSLNGVIERHLRNAEAHEEYRVDPVTREIELKDGTRMSPDELAERTADLSGAIAAIDAAVACHMIDTGRLITPKWLADGGASGLVEAILRTVAAGLGTMIDGYSMEGDVVTVRVPLEPPLGREQARMLLTLARPFAPTATSFEVQMGDRLLAAFGSGVIDGWSAAPTTEQTVALIEMLYDSALRCGEDPVASLRDAVALCIKCVMAESAAGSSSLTRKELKRIQQRLKAVARFASRHNAGEDPDLKQPLAQLRNARESLKNAPKSREYGRRFGESLQALFEWADSQPQSLLGD